MLSFFTIWNCAIQSWQSLFLEALAALKQNPKILEHIALDHQFDTFKFFLGEPSPVQVLSLRRIKRRSAWNKEKQMQNTKFEHHWQKKDPDYEK